MPDGEPPDANPEPASPEADAPSRKMARNPGAGCIIVIIALLSLSFLVGFGIWNLFKLDRELAKFTEVEPRPTPVPDLVEQAAAVNVLNSKIETFTTDAGHQREAVLSLTPAELNLAIAAFDQFESLRRTFFVKSIEDGQLHIDISFTMNGPPTEPDKHRYLNGTMVTTPRLAGGELYFVVDRLEVPGKTVPDGFLGQFSPYRPTQRYLADATLGPWMKRLTGLSVEDGALTLRIDPAETPPASGPPPLERQHIVRAAVLLAIVLLAFTGFMIYAAKRNRELKQRDRDP